MTAESKSKSGTHDKKRRGYSRRSRSEHPGVTIASEKRRDGSVVVVLRWSHPGTNRRCKETVKDASGLPVTSRERAKAAALAKSKELLGERKRVDEGKAPTDTDTTWEDLKARHTQHLEGKGRARKTIADYGQSWPHLLSWPRIPARPFKLKKADLEDFVLHLRRQRNKYTGAKWAGATVEAIVRHIKAILNYGRRSLACVRLDSESINDALDTGRRERLEPVAYTTQQLVDILEKAVELDETNEREKQVFPLLATFMLTGCRRGELERLRWFQTEPGKPESYVDFDGERLVIWSTKTHRHRHVPFRNRPVLRKLLACMSDETNVKKEPFVFGGTKSLAISDRRDDEEDAENGEEEAAEDDKPGRSLKQQILAVREKSGVPFKVKGLRSTLATYLANSNLGTNLYQVAYELGHDYAVLTKHYAQHRELPKEQADAETIEDLLCIAPVLNNWLKANQGDVGRVIPMKRAAGG